MTEDIKNTFQIVKLLIYDILLTFFCISVLVRYADMN